jgi:phosphate:Na+ symporter
MAGRVWREARIHPLSSAAMIAALLGGIGLFLLGMVLLTDGLKAAAGEALRSVLIRFTGGPVRAMASGAAATAVVQSSSATVLTTIGFVSAGLLTFPQAVGVIFGANLGTTSTGWIVSLLGLKLSMSAAALPLVGVGALTRLLARGRVAEGGLALAGFGLIFVGIDVLQGGMATLATRIDPGTFPGATRGGLFLLVGLGAVMTVVMQSSSAAIATTLTALHSGAIGIDQAAALVVGQNIGTTVKAGLAAIGASTAVRRTALAHILFNGITGAIALGLIPAVLVVDRRLAATAAGSDPAVIIAAFHTTFNLLGVVVLAPFITRFADLVTRLVPERGPHLTRHLDPALATVPAVAVEAARKTVMAVAALQLDVLAAVLARPGSPADSTGLHAADLALAETRRFLGGLHAARLPGDQERHLAVLHTIDHLERLVERLRAAPSAAAVDDDLVAAAEVARRELDPVRAWLRTEDPPAPVDRCERLAAELAERRRAQRTTQLQAAAAGSHDPDTVLERLDGMRWLDTSVYHVWRVVHHLAARTADTQTVPDE